MTRSKLSRNKSIPAKGRNKRFGRLVKKHLSEAELFEDRYLPDPNSGCWHWILSGPNGYGYFRYKKTQRFAHRAAWEIHKGAIPEGLLVCHKCDVRCCVNPDHLFLGTHQDNNDDMIKKGRYRCPHKPHKLNATIAVEIYKAEGFHKDVAVKYGISREMVGSIKRGETWSHATRV